jgi:hypothetical protein
MAMKMRTRRAKVITKILRILTIGKKDRVKKVKNKRMKITCK